MGSGGTVAFRQVGINFRVQYVADFIVLDETVSPNLVALIRAKRFF